MKPRRYREEDFHAVLALFGESVRTLGRLAYSAAQCAAWAPEPPDEALWRERLAGLQTLVMDDRGRLLGFLSYSESEGMIDLLYTAPGCERRGVASALYQTAEARLLGQGVCLLRTKASLLARPFFERHGFLVDAEENAAVRGLVFRRFAMSKALPTG